MSHSRYEFRPPVRRGVARTLLAVFVVAAVAVPLVRIGATPSARLTPAIITGSRLAAGLLLAFLVPLLLLGPRRMRYHLRPGFLDVRTLFGSRSWATDGMRARRHRPRVTLRLMGTAAPGYYTGLFRADGVTTRIYATHLDEGILIESTHRVFLSPADPTGFLAQLHAAGATIEE